MNSFRLGGPAIAFVQLHVRLLPATTWFEPLPHNFAKPLSRRRAAETARGPHLGLARGPGLRTNFSIYSINLIDIMAPLQGPTSKLRLARRRSPRAGTASAAPGGLMGSWSRKNLGRPRASIGGPGAEENLPCAHAR